MVIRRKGRAMRKILKSSLDRGGGRGSVVVAGCGGSSSMPSSSSGAGAAPARTAARSRCSRSPAGSTASIPATGTTSPTTRTSVRPTQRTLYGCRPDGTPARRPTSRPALPKLSRTAARRSRSRSGPASTTARRCRTGPSVAADIKYAIERCFLPQVGNGYAFVYYAEHRRRAVQAPATQAAEHHGHPDAERDDARDQDDKSGRCARRTRTRSRCRARSRCRRTTPQKYDTGHARRPTAAPGVHRPVHDPGRRQRARSQHRLPGRASCSCSCATRAGSGRPTIRPAYLDEIAFKGGNDITVASRQILSGKSMISGDFAAPPPAILKQG